MVRGHADTTVGGLQVGGSILWAVGGCDWRVGEYRCAMAALTTCCGGTCGWQAGRRGSCAGAEGGMRLAVP
jgi:hypothetical protein